MTTISYVALVKPYLVVALVTLFTSSAAWADYSLSGEAGIEQRYFFQQAAHPEQPRAQGSAYVLFDIHTELDDGINSFVFKPFFRVDQEDSERTHADIREAVWLHAADNWELKVGIDKVFWGQTESLHLVDIINQTDAVEAVDGEDKLGQPMVAYTHLFETGSLSAYIMPYFRERTFTGQNGRFRTALAINTDNPLFESEDEQSNIDFALRWEQSLDAWEIGLSYFNGTNREPELVLSLDSQGNPQLLPFYRQISQVGVDLLLVAGDWLWKFEGIYREADSDNAISPLLGMPITPEVDAINYFAAVVGFEYTMIGILDTSQDLGILAEYQYDERENNFFAPAQNDLMIGFRWVLNDIDSTEMLFGYIQDLDDLKSRSAFIEASSRMSQNWRWRLEGYFFTAEDPFKPLFFVRQDDFIQFGVEYFF